MKENPPHQKLEPNINGLTCTYTVTRWINLNCNTIKYLRISDTRQVYYYFRIGFTNSFPNFQI
jgi:hypothetical protein